MKTLTFTGEYRVPGLLTIPAILASAIDLMFTLPIEPSFNTLPIRTIVTSIYLPNN